jgi:hypothetical protein
MMMKTFGEQRVMINLKETRNERDQPWLEQVYHDLRVTENLGVEVEFGKDRRPSVFQCQENAEMDVLHHPGCLPLEVMGA